MGGVRQEVREFMPDALCYLSHTKQNYYRAGSTGVGWLLNSPQEGDNRLKVHKGDPLETGRLRLHGTTPGVLASMLVQEQGIPS